MSLSPRRGERRNLFLHEDTNCIRSLMIFLADELVGYVKSGGNYLGSQFHAHRIVYDFGKFLLKQHTFNMHNGNVPRFINA